MSLCADDVIINTPVPSAYISIFLPPNFTRDHSKPHLCQYKRNSSLTAKEIGERWQNEIVVDNSLHIPM